MFASFHFPELESFPDVARIWLYGFDRRLNGEEKVALEKQMRGFLENWLSHGERVKGGYSLLFDQVMVLCTENTSISGCAIDESVKEIKAFRDRYGINGLDGGRIFYRDGKGIQSLLRDSFATLVSEGAVGNETLVLDLTLDNLGQIRRGEIQKPFEQSWHAKAFPLPSP